jgi:hypothetical protein
MPVFENFNSVMWKARLALYIAKICSCKLRWGNCAVINVINGFDNRLHHLI